MNVQAPSKPQRPREYAAVILAEPSRERRIELLNQCPADWRELVEEYVRAAFAKVKAYRVLATHRARSLREPLPAAPRREDMHDIVNHPRSAPEVGNKHLAELRALVGGGHGR